MASSQERWVCPSCGTPLNIARLGIYAKVACPTCGHVDRVHPELGNFFVEGVLGLGGMSVVLRARDLVLDRPLAIKLLNEFYRDQPERIARFEHECELMAKVRHENVVSVYSAGWENGQFYIAMELINGRNLEELIHESGSMEPAQALDVIRQVTLGLDAAYRAGLLHRDMKPGNIIICENGLAKVLDFGLSLGNLDEDTEEIIWATPFYVPPETLLREDEDLRTDIYALGMTLRHLVSGQDKFESAPQTIDEMLACKRTLPRMAELMPGLDEAYCELIDHMTGFDPDSRPDSYASLLLEIDEVRHALSATGQAVKAAARRQLIRHTLIGAAVTLVLGTGAAILCSHLAKPAPVRQYIASEEHLEWRECDAISRSMNLMQTGDIQQACAILASLAASEGEPVACAWAALHARMLTDLMGNLKQESENARYRARLEYHLSRTPAPAGRGTHAELKRLHEGQGGKPTHPVLAAAAHLESARESILAGQLDAAKSALKDCVTKLKAAGAAYAPLAEMLSQIQPELPTQQQEHADNGYAQQYAAKLACLELQPASYYLKKMEFYAKDDEKKRLAVQYEALELMLPVVQMLQRHSLMPEAGKEVSVQDLQSLVAQLDEPGLEVEVGTLLLMAQGNFKEAAALNPYARKPDSTEPFAIIMRDWLSRVN